MLSKFQSWWERSLQLCSHDTLDIVAIYTYLKCYVRYISENTVERYSISASTLLLVVINIRYIIYRNVILYLVNAKCVMSCGIYQYMATRRCARSTTRGAHTCHEASRARDVRSCAGYKGASPAQFTSFTTHSHYCEHCTLHLLCHLTTLSHHHHHYYSFRQSISTSPASSTWLSSTPRKQFSLC